MTGAWVMLRTAREEGTLFLDTALLRHVKERQADDGRRLRVPQFSAVARGFFRLFSPQAGSSYSAQSAKTYKHQAGDEGRTHTPNRRTDTHHYIHRCCTASERGLVMKQFICRDSLSNWLTSGSSRSSRHQCVCVCVMLFTPQLHDLHC